MDIFFTVAGMLAVMAFVVFALSKRGNKELSSSTRGLSPVARQVVKEYNELPVDSRPVPDIVSIVRDIDARTALDSDDRYNHFNGNYFDLDPNLSGSGYDFNWSSGRKYYNCNHSKNGCKFYEYYGLHLQIAQVKKELKAKEQALLDSRYAGNTDALAELESGLRREVDIQRDITRQLRSS